MPKNSTEIGQRRHYHWRPEGAPLCGCTRTKYVSDCPYLLPSVTSALKAYPKEWLGAWAAKVTAETAVAELDELRTRIVRDGAPDAIAWLKRTPWVKRDAAAERGTVVHKAAEDEAIPDDVPENARPRYRSYLGWLDLYRPRIRAREGQVFNLTHGYAGSFDLICDLYDTTFLVDIKTGHAGAEARLQQAAYVNAEFVGADDAVDERASRALWDVDRAAVLKLTDEGFQFIEVGVEFEVFDAFLDVLDVYRWWTAHDRDGLGGEIVLPQTPEEVA